MIPDAVVLHHVPGRMRLRVASAKGSARQLREIGQALAPMQGVRDVTVSPTIGTLVVQYDPALFSQFPARLVAHATERSALRIDGAFKANVQARESIADQSMERFAENLNKRVQALTGHAINLKELFPLGIIVYAVLFVDKAVNAAQWLSWLQFAFSSYFELHQDEPIAKLSAAIATLRAEMSAAQRETLESLTNQIEGLQETLRTLTEQGKRS
jgi:uncharacterized coiled-coil protein SlyX